MHIDSGKIGSPLPSAWLLLGCVVLGCATETTSTRPPETAQPANPTPAAPAEEAQAVVEAPGAPTPEAPAEISGESGATPAGEAPVSAQEAPAVDEALPGTDEEAPPALPVPPPAPPQKSVSGSLDLRYRGRFTGDDQDHDARAVLTLDLADPRAPWIRGYLMARADLDLDGLDEGPIFQDLSDTYDGSLVTKLYLAYAELDLGPRPEDSPGTLRIGRQSDTRLPEVLRLDGVSYLTRAMGKQRVEVGLYGGVPVHLYESSSDGDQAYGTFVEAQPWEGGRARLDWMHLEDELVLGDEQDDLFGLGVWQDLARHWRLEGELTRLESEARDMRLRALYQDPESQTLARLGYYELQETQTVRVTELDPFYESLLDYYPFRQVNLNVSRAFGEHTTIDAGYDIRRVSDSDDVSEFNRDWERYYATATLHDAPVEGLALSITGDLWDGDDQDTNSLGADLSFEHEAWRTSLGTYYSLYKYQLLELSEHEDVRTYYVRALRDLSQWLRLDLGYELEDDDLEIYHTLRLGLLWRF